MRKSIFIITAVFLMWTITLPAWAAEDHPGGGHHGAAASDEMSHGHDMEQNMGHDMGQDKGMPSGKAMKNYKHSVVVDGIDTEFEVMSLASMNMKDPAGNTHHIMVKFFKEGMDHPMKGVVGKIKVIGPDKKEQTNALKDYGDILAANFTFKEKGDYGVICLFKTGDQKHTVKFWYPHKG